MNDERFHEFLKTSDLGKQFEQSLDDDRQQKRTAAVDELSEARAKHAEVFAAHTQKLKPLQAKFDKAEVAYREAFEKLRDASNKRASDNHSRTQQIARLERTATEHAPREISMFIKEMWQEIDRTHARLDFRDKEVKMLSGERRTECTHSNRRTVDTRVEACRDAIKYAEAMLVGQKPDDLERLETLKAELPPVKLEALTTIGKVVDAVIGPPAAQTEVVA